MSTPKAPTADPTLANALRRSEPLVGLLQRMRESQERREAIASLLPASMAAGVRAGPLDDSAWVLLVGSNASAAKLRQLLPALQQALLDKGWAGPPIKLQVLPRA